MSSVMPNVITVYAWPDGSWCEAHELSDMLAIHSDDFVKLSIDIGDHDSWAEIVQSEVERYFYIYH